MFQRNFFIVKFIPALITIALLIASYRCYAQTDQRQMSRPSEDAFATPVQKESSADDNSQIGKLSDNPEQIPSISRKDRKQFIEDVIEDFEKTLGLPLTQPCQKVWQKSLKCIQDALNCSRQKIKPFGGIFCARKGKRCLMLADDWREHCPSAQAILTEGEKQILLLVEESLRREEEMLCDSIEFEAKLNSPCGYYSSEQFTRHECLLRRLEIVKRECIPRLENCQVKTPEALLACKQTFDECYKNASKQLTPQCKAFINEEDTALECWSHRLDFEQKCDSLREICKSKTPQGPLCDQKWSECKQNAIEQLTPQCKAIINEER